MGIFLRATNTKTRLAETMASVAMVDSRLVTNFDILFKTISPQGHRTGYVYHQPLIRSDPKPRSEVAHPAASSSVTYFYDDDKDGSKYQSPMKLMNRKQAGEKTKWLNTPNTYTKVETEEELKEGDETPKKKTVVRSLDGESELSQSPCYRPLARTCSDFAMLIMRIQDYFDNDIR